MPKVKMPGGKVKHFSYSKKGKAAAAKAKKKMMMEKMKKRGSRR